MNKKEIEKEIEEKEVVYPNPFGSDETFLEEVIKDLYMDHPLFGEILINTKRIFVNADDKRCPTACISPNMVMKINRKFFNSLPLREKKGVIVHELYHPLLRHFERFADEYRVRGDESPAETMYRRDICNIAEDCAINQIIKDSKKEYDLNEKTFIFHETFCEMFKLNPEKVKKLETAEYYYGLLQSDMERFKEMMDNMSEAFKKMIEDMREGHREAFEQWEKLPVKDKMKIQKILEYAIRKQVERDMGWGVGMGDSIAKYVPQKTQTDNKVWKRCISRTVGENPVAETTPVYGKQSRKNKASLYGSKHNLENNCLYVMLDTSGSISDRNIQLFLGHMNKAMRSCDMMVTLIECDDGVHKVTEKVKKISYTKGITIHGRGGTDLTKGLDEIIKREGKKRCRLVVLTDAATPWRDEPTIITTAIFTDDGCKLDGVRYSAVLKESYQD